MPARKKRSLPWSLKVWLMCYSVLIQLLASLLRPASGLSGKLRTFCQGRRLGRQTLAALSQERGRYRRSVLFYCSSAGEYEQAKPLLERFKARGDTFCLCVFFSQSGLTFAEARSETTAYLKAPFDTLWAWQKLMAAARPDLTIVVRHELWPAFLAAAYTWGELYLIDATASPGRAEQKISCWVKGRLLRFFDRIYAVGPDDQHFFETAFGVTPELIHVVGDTKFDRVRERALAHQGDSQALNEKLTRSLGAARRLIVGSAWHKDVQFALEAYRQMAAVSESGSDWQLILAPHDVGPAMIRWVEDACAEAGCPSVRLSALDELAELPSDKRSILVVDKMGILAELYGCCELALVGGALHHKVHNVLEPACRGLFLSFGPCYKNSQEAVLLAQLGLATVVETPEALTAWWQSHARTSVGRDHRLLQKVDELCGAAMRIEADAERYLTGGLSHRGSPGG